LLNELASLPKAIARWLKGTSKLAKNNSKMAKKLVSYDK